MAFKPNVLKSVRMALQAMEVVPVVPPLPMAGE
jgi:hypothetical protein